MLTLTCCRTTEANYKAAYEKAIAGREDDSAVNNTIYENIRRRAVTSTQIVDGDTVAVKRERVKLVEPAAGELMQDAYVVVAQFKQLFNAKSLCARYKEQGYPDARLLATAEPLYYIAIKGGSKDEMLSLCRKYAAKPVLPVKSGYPLVLLPVK